MYLWLLLIGVFLLSLLISRRMAGLRDHALLDQPIERSAHTVATPRGGGLAIVTSLTLWIAGLQLMGLLSISELLILLCAIPVAVTGFIDDFRGLPVRARLPVHLMVAVTALVLLGAPPLPTLLGLPVMVQSVLLIIALVWMLNLYNFMDGIDAIAAAQCLFVSAGAAILLFDHHAGLAWVCIGLFVVTLGFLTVNLPPAKLFMGDVGSTFLGFFIGLLALVTHYQEILPIWVWPLLMGTFVADTTYTLIVRAIAGHKVTEGHSTHAFQRLSRRFQSHGPVVLIYMGINIVWLFPLAWLTTLYPQYGVLIALSGIVPLLLIAAGLGAGKAETVDHE